jgi:hypothetical protein
VARRDVWEELQRRGATTAIVPFTGRAGEGGRVGTIIPSRLDGEHVVTVERWSGRDALADALEAPVWDRYGTFAGQRRTAGRLTWELADRQISIDGRRGGEKFQEVLE